jgi:hypothetical protein
MNGSPVSGELQLHAENLGSAELVKADCLQSLVASYATLPQIRPDLFSGLFVRSSNQRLACESCLAPHEKNLIGPTQQDREPHTKWFFSKTLFRGSEMFSQATALRSVVQRPLSLCCSPLAMHCEERLERLRPDGPGRCSVRRPQ